METLSGSVERITFFNPENGYSVLRLRPERSKVPGTNREGLVTVVGNLPELAPGEYLRLSGKWSNHPKHGRQFQVEICEQTLPVSVTGIRRYLGSGLIKGIGGRLAERIVDHFGEETLQVIEISPEKLVEVPDIGPKRSRQIVRAWEEQKQIKEIMLFLHGHGVSTNLAIKIYKHYGDSSLQIVESDPYRLARDIYGVGFKTADGIARTLGLPEDHPSRIEAGVIYALQEMSEDGHVYSPMGRLSQRAVELLGVSEALIPPAVKRLDDNGRVRTEVLPILDEEVGREPEPSEASPPVSSLGEESGIYGGSAVYLTSLYYSEVGSAERLRAIAGAIPSRLSDISPAFVAFNSDLSPEQEDAVRVALSHPVSVLTGGPGTGKTTTVKALINAMESGQKRYALASPTGRAAKRLSEATGRPASTVHRLLGFSPREGFKYNADNPIPIDLLVVDEASMLDLPLANHLLKAIQPGTHLLLVGDVDQLPSVGPGDVLRDVIESGLAPVTRLSLIFRQAAGSHIVTNAHRINQGQMPFFPKESQDFFLFPVEKAEDAADWVQDIVCNRIPEKFHLEPRKDIQVLSPMYRGPAGVTALNERLQETLNPLSLKKPERTLFGVTYRVGDKVMQTQNDYEKEVYNGDIGNLTAIDPINHTLTVEIDTHRIAYDWSEADQLVLAYAISVHKSQGAEFPAVVMPLLTAHYMMLQRNLLYTAITRAKQLCVLVGNRRAIAIAVHNDKVSRRYTALDWRLSQ
jgi:exodeoxyribonuclease V alpha subunit